MKNFLTIISAVLAFAMISCNDSSNKQTINQLKANIEQDLNQLEGEFAIAFLDLQNSEHSIMINENEVFHAASTMKTPVMIELFKQAAVGKFKLRDSIILKNEFKSIVDGSLYQMEISDDSSDATYKKYW